jgi:peptide/nickel transport system substrate-binding protein
VAGPRGEPSPVVERSGRPSRISQPRYDVTSESEKLGMSVEDREPGWDGQGRSRRSFIRDSVAWGGTLVGGSAFLAACGSGTSGTSPGTAAAAGTPKRGGALRVGISAGSATDNLDAHYAPSTIDIARGSQLYDWLYQRDPENNLKPRLAVESSLNSAGDELTIKLRHGVKFHDGKPLTAEDVVYSYKRMLDPKTGADVTAQLALVLGPSGVTAVDPTTVKFKFKSPYTNFADIASQTGAGIVPVGYDPKKPIGTGPFKAHSFTPGQRSVFVRNDDFWQDVYPDSVEIIDLPDDAARINALVSGVVDAIDTVPVSLVPQVQGQSNLQVLKSEAGTWNPITMRVDRAPFNDVRVRQAFRLIVDRPQIIKQAYGDNARLGNDLYSIDDPLYDKDLPQRVQDIEQAKSLLKQAGQENLTVELVTAEVSTGVIDQCVVFAQQAKAAGVNVKITKLDTTNFYNDQYLQRVFSVDWWSTISWILATGYTLLPTAAYNETHVNDPKLNKLFGELIKTQDPALQKEMAHQVQAALYDDSGYIIPCLAGQIDAYSKKVTGFVPDKSGFGLTSYRFRQVWFV